MIALMAKAAGDAAKVESSRSVWVYVVELPPRQMIEFGHLLPEAGDKSAELKEAWPSNRRHL